MSSQNWRLIVTDIEEIANFEEAQAFAVSWVQQLNRHRFETLSSI